MSKLTEEQESELFEKFREEREKELSGLKVPQKAAQEMLKGMLRDKITTDESHFKKKALN